jgi:hypothetical protein
MMDKNRRKKNETRYLIKKIVDYTIAVIAKMESVIFPFFFFLFFRIRFSSMWVFRGRIHLDNIILAR